PAVRQQRGCTRAEVHSLVITVILPHLDATYKGLGDGLEDVLTLSDGPAPSNFFLLKAPEGTTATEQPDRSWVLVIPGHAQPPSDSRLPPPTTRDQECGARSAQCTDERQGGQKRLRRYVERG